MHETRNDMNKDARKKVCDILNVHLASLSDLTMQTKQAHWNVKGKEFIALHGLFDAVYLAITPFVDEVAERCIALGGTALGTLQSAIKGTLLKTYPTDITVGDDHIAALSKALAAYGKMAREAIDQTDKLGDKDTADLFTGISREIDKQLWMVEAHEQ
ncbi:MAG: DNA starvation/stationary phase protection protein Dps [Planctomycetes bacterium]|nr:DNA starvation/stationary phase protection protein Dps [Planctomycetota bacterium]